MPIHLSDTVMGELVFGMVAAGWSSMTVYKIKGRN